MALAIKTAKTSKIKINQENQTANASYFFAGANSGAGFQNLFPDLLDMDLNNWLDFIILKGGPGVGKNTFMREIGKSMQDAGFQVEYILCSGDPDSLDGVIVPELRCAVADGTSPHILEPKYPAAVDRYLNLGKFYDITAAKTDAEAIQNYTKAYQAAYRRAYQAFRAARQVELTAAAVVNFDKTRAERRFQGVLKRELRYYNKNKNTRSGEYPGEYGRVTRRFLGSVTYQGYIWRFDSVENLASRIYEIRDRFGFAGKYLKRLQNAAIARGWDVISCVSPEEPERIEHIIIPGLNLAFITTRPNMEYNNNLKPFRRIRLDALLETQDRSPRLELRMADALREEGIAALRDAKREHDHLEAVYNPYVDFDGVRALAALETGRWLSFR